MILTKKQKNFIENLDLGIKFYERVSQINNQIEYKVSDRIILKILEAVSYENELLLEALYLSDIEAYTKYLGRKSIIVDEIGLFDGDKKMKEKYLEELSVSDRYVNYELIIENLDIEESK